MGCMELGEQSVVRGKGPQSLGIYLGHFPERMRHVGYGLELDDLLP